AMLKVTDRFSNRVDLLIGLKGLDPQAFSRAIDVPFQGKTLRFIGREDFIAMKAFAGGPMDLVDAARALTAGGASLDLDLVRSLAKRFGTEASESLDRRREAKRLTEMAGLEQNNPIRPSSTVLPHGPGKNRCHDEQRRRPGKIGLIRAIRTCHARTHFGRESCQTVVPGLVVIHSPLEPVHPERHQIYLTRVPGTAGRAGLVRKSSEYI